MDLYLIQNKKNKDKIVFAHKTNCIKNTYQLLNEI